ncbi:MAG TPA: hypothetical protein VNT60_05000, partial [Deinococcales bacterium]|nr:hypothetical protein [Deinococcales bacterium]
MPALTFLAVDGVGDPNGLHFEQAVGALYAVAYTLKFALKKADGPDYTVMPLGALWGSGEQDDSALPREEWPWTALICQPEPLPAGMLDEAIAKCRAKDPNPALDRLRLIDLNE